MDIRKAGWRLFSVRQDEFAYAVPLFALYLLSGCFYATGQIYAETLFLKTYGAPGLSRFFVYNGVSLIAGGLLYNLFILKVPPRRGYIALVALFAGDQAGFEALIAAWPVDVQNHLKALATDAFWA